MGRGSSICEKPGWVESISEWSFNRCPQGMMRDEMRQVHV